MPTIQEIVAQRQINAVFHFTRTDNLPSIMAHGLCVPSVCTSKNIKSVTNDKHRHDGVDGVCASVGFPNYKLFWPFRQDNPGAKWVLLAIHPRILWETDCAFCITNAAHASVANIPIQNRKGDTAFGQMFDDYANIKRSDLKIRDAYTTNPQAEVLLLQGAPIKYIFGLVFETSQMQLHHKAQYEGKPPNHQHIKTYHLPHYFRYRSDFSHWKKADG